MSIEFACPNCQQLLRTPDGSAGKKAKCPSCGQNVPIPGTARPPAASPLAQPSAPTQPATERSGKFDADNPYAPPTHIEPDWEATTASDQQLRDGPPWERDGKSLRTFWRTAMLVFNSPTHMFSTMRRQGGLGAPLLYALCGGMVGGLAAGGFQLALQLVMFAAVGNGNGPEPAALFGGLMIGALIVVVLLPVGLIIGLFLNAGIVHLVLMVLKGDRHGFETTFRVAAYCTGSTSLLLLIPLCGQYVQGIVNLVYMVFGISAAHEISGGKAAAAVLLPMAVCIISVIALVMVFVGLALSAAPAPQF